MFELEGVELAFEGESLRTIARAALSRGSGARGLRSILEDLMLDVMYDLPEDKGLARVLVDDDVAAGRKPPVRERAEERKTA
jgi:ATP-dependent Clp protease ATP-binding subunit ClpX